MIIDAMDILYFNQVDIFCLVSSDSDFTRLAMRLREAGKEVIGMGMKKTPQPFIAACNKFVYIELISHSLESGQVKEVSPESASIVEKESVSPLKEGIQILQASDNQLTFEEYLKGLYHQGVIDMDDFKIYNDTYGHNAGDLALITTVEAIRRCIRKNDTLIRYGGDEFLLVLQGISETMFREKLKQIRTEIYNANVPTYSRLQLSASIGGVMSAGRTVEETVMEADKFMYLAKNRKNTVVTEKDFANEEGEDGTALEALKVKQQILIVDDSEMNREILTEMLQDDFRILEAENGEEALKMLKQYDTGISLMLLDIVMPVMNGYEATRQIRALDRADAKTIPIIAMTANAFTEDRLKSKEAGMDEHITKPIDSKLLVKVIAALTDKNAQRPK